MQICSLTHETLIVFWSSMEVGVVVMVAVVVVVVMEMVMTTKMKLVVGGTKMQLTQLGYQITLIW